MKRICLFSLSMLMLMPGCVVWDIEEGIATSNQNLEQIEGELSTINANLDTVNARMSSMDEQLMSLQAQIDATNAHLESLRKTINNIDNTIPFLKLSGDDEEEQEALENGQAEELPAKKESPDPEAGGS